MRIALVTTTLTIGGAEKQVRDLASMYVSQGHQVLIVSCKGPTLQEIPGGVELIELHGDKSIGGLFRTMRNLRIALRAWRPNVIHGHMVVANIISRIVSLFVGHAVVISTAHSVDEGGRKVRNWAYRCTDFLADLTTNVSQHAVDHYIQRKISSPERIRLMNNGVDIKKYQFSAHERERLRVELGVTEIEKICLAVGRLVEAKDYPNLLVAFSHVIQVLPDAKLLIVGEGPESVDLQTICQRENLSSSVRFLGARTDVPALMSASDLFVLSSAWEGAPLVVIEAMAAQLPVVATNVGGVSDVLGGFGRSVAPHDPEALATAIIAELKSAYAKSDPVLVNARCSAMERFSIDAVSKQWIVLYRSLYQRRFGMQIE